jgi:multiple antibiotic resistance protein
MFDLHIKDIITVSMILFAVIDIIGSIPAIIQIRQKVGDILRKQLWCRF